MNKDENYLLINEYIDDELDREKENFLFSILASDNEAREYFKKMTRFKQLLSASGEEYPDSLDTKMEAINTKKPNAISAAVSFKNAATYIAYLVLLVVVFLGINLFDRVSSQSMQLEAAYEKIERQKDVIELITSNQIYPVTIEADYNDEIIIEANL